MAVTTPAAELGASAPDFALPGTDGTTHRLADFAGRNGTVVAFICNHCPYVRAAIGRIVSDARTLAAEGIGFVAVNANDASVYPADSFEGMVAFARERDLPFPYLHDETQAVARAYDAACTPDFFGLDRDGRIQYRGRLDAGRTDQPPPEARRELLEAMRHIAATGRGPGEQLPSIGCSIKWKS